MNFAEFSIRNQVFSVIVILLVLLGGWTAYQEMPRLEDPDFTIRTALVITQYPGASPREVAEEVTTVIEQALQQMQEVDVVTSVSSAGVSEISVDIKFEFSPDKASLQVIWAKLRNKIKDIEKQLPPGVQPPTVVDEFGDVYGLYYFITGAGFTPSELRTYAKQLKDELFQVEGVAKVALDGVQQEVIYVEFSSRDLVSSKISLDHLFNILSKQNSVLSAGDVKVGDLRLIIDPSGAIDSVEAIRNLLVTTRPDGGMVYLKDIAHVWRGYRTPPNKLYRYDGQSAIAIGVSQVLGGNIVNIGKAVNARLAESESRRPLGIEIHEFYHQGKAVEASVENFVWNVVAALAIVIATLFFFMGARSAFVIGAILLLTIFATLATMDLIAIPMHRISLGALIIALGMMVDNAIVVTEGILVGVQRGREKLTIAREIISQTQWPLLAGTLVGCIAFGPIGFAPGSTAEYTGHLFWVILIALLFSWLFAVTLTPLFCYWLFKASPVEDKPKSQQNLFYRSYDALLSSVLEKSWLTVGIVFGLFVVSIWGFQFVKSGFFPTSTIPQIVVDYWLPQGTDISQTNRDMKKLEAHVRQLDGVNAAITTVGGGGLRYMLIYGPESANSSYGQLLIRTDDYQQIDALIPEIENHIFNNFLNAQAKVWRFVLGPGGGSTIEATFKGPDPVVLRKLASQAEAIMVEDGGARSIKNNWRQPVSVIEPQYAEARARRAGISREDFARALVTNFSGRQVGVFREGDDLLPIISRAPAPERVGLENIRNILVMSSTTGEMVPVAQLIDGFKTIWRDGLLRREGGLWTIKAQSDPLGGELTSQLFSRIRPQVEAIPLPAGYTLEWDGEYGAAQESNEALASTLPIGFLSMVIVVFVLFGKVRQPLVIWLVVPLALIGVVFGLVLTRTPLEFMGILGLLSLSGLLIKNAIVLVDQIDFDIARGRPRFSAVIEASVSRVRPVMMGSLTTILGVIPLFFDAFFQSMSVVLVFGLGFATLLTLIIVPVLYLVFFKIRPEEK